MKNKIVFQYKFSLLFLYLILLIKSIYSSYIILYFKTEKLGGSSQNIIQTKFDINLHTYLEIGKPKQKIKIYFRDEFFSFFITDTNTTYNEDEIKNPIIPRKNIKENINTFYNSKLSSTYKNISDYQSFFIDIYYRKGYLSKETFFFNIDNSNIKQKISKEYKNIDFVLANKIKPNRTLITGAIGLLVEEYFLEGAKSFVRMLVKNNVTSFNLWNKRYYNDEYGYFIFGDFPHEYEKDIYNKEQYVETDVKYNVYIQKWNLEFDEIFSIIKNNGDENDEDDYYINDIYKYFYLNITLYGELKHNLGLIIGTVEYQKLIEEHLFNYYLNKNICHKQKILITVHNDDKVNYTYYFCDNNNKLFNKKNFPTLYLNQLNLKYIFELNNDDLFILHDNKWYFMIIFEGEEIANPIHKWMFGEPFLKKYQFVFDPINYKIGLYNPLIPYVKNKQNKIEQNKEYNKTQIISLGVLVILFCIFIFLVIRYLYKKYMFNRTINNTTYVELKNIPFDEYTKYSKKAL